MKALILAAGRGKRLGEITQDKNKCLLEIAGRPLIAYSLDCASKIPQISEIVIIVGYQAEEIINNFGDHYLGKPVRYVFQKEQKGLVNAIENAEAVLNKEDFLLMLGDELMTNPRHLEMMKAFEDKDIFALCGILLVENRDLIKKTYSISQSDDGKITQLIEKPQNPENNIMGTGNCLFRKEIFSYIAKTPINKNRGEKELPDLIQCAINDGKIVKPFNLCSRYFNVNLKEEIHDAQSYFAHFSESERKLL
ncbi:MAG: nucleotidyl transferase [Candidatus Nealsonbacteria bacterium RIFCSPLOWO2_01_FULL_41_9]|uniref:Nucleotidyl transferase n=1 Tax=Candidatus Nealsonbacteria bacterium RIFCSPLOWO2_01_FULL_41_9 TaxID=1801671 RepID=A0A1G2EDA5_9BACT|nr:MAG: nucleotidyl transferase [Candidatus Nealsonbacteria bacterium RIFCSPLOWO2_01_FULL_41_9]